MTFAYLQTRNLLIGFGTITVLSLLVGVAGGWYWLAGIPAAALFGYLALVDFRKIFYLLFFFIPLTVEVWLPNGTVTDMPTEFMTVLLMGIYFVYMLRNGRTLSTDFIKHPITLALLAHLGWFLITSITSQNLMISFKYSLAKIWYVTTFFFLAGHILKEEKDLKRLVWVVLFPLIFTIFYVLRKHAAVGFSFDAIHTVVQPFYRNKVAYACMLTIFFPFVWFTRQMYRTWSWPWMVLAGATVILLIGIQFSYTRAAYGTLAIAVAAYFGIKWRLMKYGLAVAALLALLYIAGMVRHNNYLDHKPVYEKTITHAEFGDLLNSTTKGQDVSTMERVYRWVAGGHMISERPVLGFGPGTFTYFYKTYTLHGFRTYVSLNTEGSGIHCYYLMTAVEQGYLGGLLFVALVFIVLLTGERIYHQTTDPARQRLVMMVMMTTVIIDGLLLMNDLVETDKIGSFFFLCMAVLVNVDIANKSAVRQLTVGSQI
ncbi:MAG: O-antigen ligase family protein [Saprospiraceae bacterium]|nr:O-antigen ligase family protein [Saprospiraceae bacterium]MCF8251279.1 O-antigen ligase family protein [Saprospiraceae bacterium]MCF8280830.1 O-antigen ligase family protein [Bacteroidales bacterium]MCF8311816.1 O-antigen ligase family protein [Saprospiraceae bacterium]MCF8441957.1 O-antigen ligase family protein [Saprospiraceae bacterium]